MRCDRLLGEHGLREDSRRTRREFAARTEAQREERDETALKALRRGWFLGAEDYLGRLVERVERIPGRRRYREKAATDVELAERIVRAGMRELGLEEKNLSGLRKSDPQKLEIAHRVRRETAMELRWIGDRLAMGSFSHVSNMLRQTAKSED